MLTGLTSLFGKGYTGPIITYNQSGHNLSHLNVIEKSGSLIKNLTFGITDTGKLKSIVKAGNSRTIKMANGGFFDHLFKHCPNLSRLAIYDSKIFRCSPWCEPFISRSITELCLYGVEYCESIRFDLSERLPSLEKLIINNCELVGSDNEEEEFMYNILIDMPETSFKTLIIKNSYTKDYWGEPFEIMIKLTTSNGIKYYKHDPGWPVTIDVDNILQVEPKCYYDGTKSDVREYDIGLDDEFCANFHIKCKSIDTLKIDISRIVREASCKITLDENNALPSVKLYTYM